MRPLSAYFMAKCKKDMRVCSQVQVIMEQGPRGQGKAVLSLPHSAL